MVDPEAKRNLDVRLAKGEITKDDYLSLHQLLNTEPSKQPFLAKTVESVSAMKERFIESRKRINPTNTQPYEVSKNLLLFDDRLEARGVQYPYQKIKTISYKAFTRSTNLIPTYHLANIWINLEGGEIVSENMSSTLLKGKMFNRILNAYDFLTSITFRYRLAPYLSNLETNGYCEHFETKIYRNGDVEHGGARVNVKLARKNKGLTFGLESDDLSNYTVITINESGGIFSSKKTKLKLSSNQDIIKYLLLWLSEQP
jgi:hypothetical protein